MVCVFFVCLFLSFSLCSKYRLLCKRSDCTVFSTAAYAKFAPMLSLFPYRLLKVLSFSEVLQLL